MSDLHYIDFSVHSFSAVMREIDDIHIDVPLAPQNLAFMLGAAILADCVRLCYVAGRCSENKTWHLSFVQCIYGYRSDWGLG